ncbi:hypothetical protein [Nodosilinea sp. FACHB-13]|uniref:hypothetical protein n=1 Tax=Cyanophyceae TaxID=3028117 RepID=UPI0018EF3FBD|nr:hypothetical protein [Nodosilinea sp. FACHB-13]
MRVLLDTNILIHRESRKVLKSEIGVLFNWLDKLKYQKCIHPLSLEELESHKDPEVVNTIKAKIKNYNLLKTLAPEVDKILEIRKKT